MNSFTRRDTIKRMGALLWVLSTGGCLQTMLSGCSSNQDVDPDLINQISRKLKPANLQYIKLTVAYDNVPYDKSLIADWGFSCCIEGLDKNILFDSGKHGRTLLTNLSKLKKHPASIDEIVVSHDHEDHISGVKTILKECPETNVSVVKSFRSSFKKSVSALGATITEVDQPTIISDHCVSTGELKDFVRNEHSLVVATNAGAIIITGCAHPGVVNIVERAKRITNSEVLLVMGGFHLLSEGNSCAKKVAASLKDLGVRYVAASHCTGGQDITEAFIGVFGNNYLQSGAGRIITSRDLS